MRVQSVERVYFERIGSTRTGLLIILSSQPCISIRKKHSVLVALTHWKHQLHDKWVVVHSDNYTTISALNKGSCRNPWVMQWLCQIFWLSATYNFRITATYISSKTNSGGCNFVPSWPSLLSHAEWASWRASGRETSPLASLLTSCFSFLSPTGAVHDQEQLLHEEFKKYCLHAFAQSTTATYKFQLLAYLRFCLYIGYSPVPCRVIHLLRYVVFRARTLPTSSIPNYLNVVCLLHMQCGYPNHHEEPSVLWWRSV